MINGGRHHDENRVDSVLVATVSELFERVHGIGHDFQQIVVFSADAMAFDHFRRCAAKIEEGGAIPCLKQEVGGGVFSDFFRRDDRAVLFNDSFFFQTFHSFRYGGLRQTDMPAELRHGDPGLALKVEQDFDIDWIHGYSPP